MEDVALLKKMLLFQGLDSLEMVQVSKRVEHRKAAAYEVVAKQGSPGASLFIVRSGKLVVSVPRDDSRELLAELGPGDHFGEVSLIDHGPRSAEVQATEESELLVLDQAGYGELQDFSPELKDKLQRNLLLDLCGKIRRTNDHLLQML
jgi:CRP/FNR family cyclic AMP-dependent transcriptional regulator